MAERPSAGDYIQELKTTVPNMVDQIGGLFWTLQLAHVRPVLIRPLQFLLRRQGDFVLVVYVFLGDAEVDHHLVPRIP